jgi:hypothetical protein
VIDVYRTKTRTKRPDLRTKRAIQETPWEIYERRKAVIVATSNNIEEDIKKLAEELGL